MKSNNKIHYLTVLCMKIYEGILKNGKIGRFLHLFLPILCFCGTLTGVFFVVGCNSDRQESKVAACSEAVQFEPIGSDYFSIGRLCRVDVAVVRSVVGKDTLVHKYVMMDSAAAGLGTDLRRRGFPNETIQAIHDAYRIIYAQGVLKDGIAEARAKYPDSKEVEYICSFIESSKRGIIL